MSRVLEPLGSCVCYPLMTSPGRRDGACVCERTGWRVREDGTPVAFTEPCDEREEMTRTDKAEMIERALAVATRDAVAARAWMRADAKPAAQLGGTLDGFDAEARTVWITASTTDPVSGEALRTWDLSRFEKNPVILWGHDAASLPIGTAEKIETTPEGLRVLVRFATERANPLAELVLNAVAERIVRAVSVGFEPGAVTELPDGTRALDGNVLLEVSFVSIGKDEDAGTAAITPDESERYIDTYERESKVMKTDAFNIDGITIGSDDPVLAARARRDAEARDAWKRTPAPGAPKAARVDSGDELDDGVIAARIARDEAAANAWKGGR